MFIDAHMLDREVDLDTLKNYLFPVAELKLFYKSQTGKNALLSTEQAVDSCSDPS